MRIENSFTVSRPVDAAWDVLLNVKEIAPCLPGARVTNVIDDRSFEGVAQIRLGPLGLDFAGKAEFTQIDPDAKVATVKARGADRKGRGGAQAEVTFTLEPVDAERTRVKAVTDLTMSGSVAQYGRASGLMQSISDEIMAEFAANLERKLTVGSIASGALAADRLPALGLFTRAVVGWLRSLFGRRPT